MPGLARSATAGFTAYVAPHTIAGPILVASYTSPHSDAAFPLAQELAEHTNAAVHVMSVVRPFSMPIYAFDAVPMALDADNSIRAGREGLLRAQRARLVAPGATWPLVIRTGEPAREIVECARELGARVIKVEPPASSASTLRCRRCSRRNHACTVSPNVWSSRWTSANSVRTPRVWRSRSSPPTPMSPLSTWHRRLQKPTRCCRSAPSRIATRRVTGSISCTTIWSAG